MYKRYLFVLDDKYTSCQLEPFVSSGPDDDCWGTVSPQAFKNARRLLSLHVNCVRLSDKYNRSIVKNGKNARVDLLNPKTLFAPYAMTYDPDVFQTNPIGWPIRDRMVQEKGYQAVQQGKPSCITFLQDNFFRQSPYTSHCSAYVAWAAQQVFGISLAPTQIGDWCHAAAEQRDIMFSVTDWWEKVDSTSAQCAANKGKLAIVARKVDDPEKEGYKQNGHIAIVLPLTWQVAKKLQSMANFPQTPDITDAESFQQFIRLYGPEITQSGGLNFSHTVASNGFANYYPADTTPGTTPIDTVLEFFVYKLYTQRAPPQQF